MFCGFILYGKVRRENFIKARIYTFQKLFTRIKLFFVQLGYFLVSKARVERRDLGSESM